MDFLLGLSPLFYIFMGFIGKAISAFIVGYFAYWGVKTATKKFGPLDIFKSTKQD